MATASFLVGGAAQTGASTVETVSAPKDASLADLRRALGVSRERLAHALGLSTKTLERAERRGTLPAGATVQQRIALMQQIAELADLVYEPEGVKLFLTLPQPRFGGRTALQLIELGDGARVFAALASDYQGGAGE